MSTTVPFALRGDRPIESAEEDRLGRGTFAKAIAQQILEAPSLDSYVVAVVGPWGSGKTSLVNMLAEEARLRSDCVVLKFNPWIFSGAEQLAGYFFRELGAQLAEAGGDRIAAAGASLKKYASLFGSVVQYVPQIGDVVKKVTDVARDVGEALSEAPSIESQRNKIRDQLGKIDRRIVVVVDDIDRLRRDEIREIVKLVRLTGDFPNVVYVLAFDRRRVEAALGDDDETGRAYLEKIVQVAYDVPAALEADIAQLLIEELNSAVEGIDHGPFPQMDWNNIFHGVVRPLFRSPRDVRRYVNALPPTLRVIGKEVALPDVLALEAVRVFMPEAFAKLPGLLAALTGGGRENSRDDPNAGAVRRFVEEAAPHEGVARELIRRVFPLAERFLGGVHYAEGYGRKWHRDRRVAVADVLRFYLQRRLPAGVVAAAFVQAAYALFGDRDALTVMLDSTDAELLENLLGRLEMYEDEFPPEQVETAVGALMDQMGRLREGKAHMFDMGAELSLSRVVLRLLRRIENEADREAIIGRVLPTLRSLSAVQNLVQLAEGHKLAGPQSVATWRQLLHDGLVRAAPARLAEERRLGRLIVDLVGIKGPPTPWSTAVIEDDAVLLRVLASAMSEHSTWSMGDVASIQSLRLPWKHLANIFGQDHLEGRVREARRRVDAEALHDRERNALDLAVRYADGWRPKDEFGENDDDEEREESNSDDSVRDTAEGSPLPALEGDADDATAPEPDAAKP